MIAGERATNGSWLPLLLTLTLGCGGGHGPGNDGAAPVADAAAPGSEGAAGQDGAAERFGEEAKAPASEDAAPEAGPDALDAPAVSSDQVRPHDVLEGVVGPLREHVGPATSAHIAAGTPGGPRD